jgi:hypothetical protein
VYQQLELACDTNISFKDLTPELQQCSKAFSVHSFYNVLEGWS